MYGIDNPQSLHELHTWSTEVTHHAEILKILVGNKNDLGDEERKIFEETAVNFALMENIDLAVECSAKIDDNVDYIFHTIAKKLLHKELTLHTNDGKRKTKKGLNNDLVKYQGTSDSMDNLFLTPKEIASLNKRNNDSCQLDQIRPRKNLFQRICSIL